MNLIKTIANTGKVVVLSLLLGCPIEKKHNDYPTKPSNGVQETSQKIKEEIPKSYFAELPRSYKGSREILKDFDGDGDPDFIIFQEDGNSLSVHSTNLIKTRFYFFENDGKGNFTLRQYYDKDIQKVE